VRGDPRRILFVGQVDDVHPRMGHLVDGAYRYHCAPGPRGKIKWNSRSEDLRI
jgi:hypothetical protein